MTSKLESQFDETGLEHAPSFQVNIFVLERLTVLDKSIPCAKCSIDVCTDVFEVFRTY